MIRRYYLLLMMLTVGQIRPMDINVQAQEYVIMPLGQLRKIAKPDELIIYSLQNNRGIVVDQDIWKLSTTLENIKEQESNNEIKLESFTSTAIKYFFDTLREYFLDHNDVKLGKYVDQLSLARLIGVINLYMFLDIENHKKEIATILSDKLLKMINAQQKIKQEDYELLNQLNPDFAQEYVLSQVINRLNQQSLEKRKLFFAGHQDIVFSVAFSSDGTKIVSGSRDDQNNLMLWDVVTGARLYNLVGHQKGILAIAFSPDGNKIVSGSESNLMIWDVATGTRLYNLAGHQDLGVASVAFSPDGSKIVSGSGGGNQNNLMIWDVATGTRLYNLAGHQGGVASVVFSPDGSKIVSGSGGNQNNLMVWDVATGARLYNLAGHQNTVWSVAFSPDGSTMVSGSGGNQNNLMVWDVATGTRFCNLVGQQGGVASVAFSPDDSKIVSGGPELMISNLLSLQELDYLKQYNATQITFLYWLCSSQEVGYKQKLDVSDQKVFNSLSYEVQNLLMDVDLVEQPWRYWLINRPWKKIFTPSAAYMIGGITAISAVVYMLKTQKLEDVLYYLNMLRGGRGGKFIITSEGKVGFAPE